MYYPTWKNTYTPVPPTLKCCSLLFLNDWFRRLEQVEHVVTMKTEWKQWINSQNLSVRVATKLAWVTKKIWKISIRIHVLLWTTGNVWSYVWMIVNASWNESSISMICFFAKKRFLQDFWMKKTTECLHEKKSNLGYD